MSSRTNPRVLFVTARWPHGPSSGSQMRSLHVARALARVGTVRLCVVDPLRDADAARRTSEEFEIETVANLEPSPGRTARRPLFDALDPRRLDLYGTGVPASAADALDAALGRHDLVWIHNLKLAYLFRRWKWPRSVMDVDDLPSTYERSAIRGNHSLRARLAAARRMLGWRRRERLMAERFDVVTVCSEADRRHLPRELPVHVIPNGFQPPQGPPRRPAHGAPPRIGFIGVMDYPPNLEGIRWFIDRCFPRLKREIPGIRLRLVGRDTRQALAALTAGTDPLIDVLGWLEDPAEEIAGWSAMIVPLRTGAGTRVKVAEAFARKCPLVSTGLGALGYEVRDGRELLLADSARGFAGACLRILRDPEGAAAMAERAWHRFNREWTWEAIAPRVWSAANDCLSRSARTAA